MGRALREYRRESGALLGTIAVGLAINIVTARTDSWRGPWRSVLDYAYLWLPLCVVLWLGWRYFLHRRTAVTWRSPESPYPGLAPFTVEREGVFFGRNREASEVLHRLERSGSAPATRIVAIVGPSGVGKSSLIRAGVIARLPRRWTVVGPLRPAADPFMSLAAALADRPTAVLQTARLLREEAASPEAPLQVVPSFLSVARGPVLLVVDQAEDLYTLTDEQDRAQWWSLLTRTLTVLPELRLLVAIRPEFRRRLTDQQAGFITRPVAIGLLDPARIRQAIAGPARAAGLTFEDDLIDRMTADATVGDALPLLSHLLQRLHLQSDGRHITVAQYEQAGEVGGAIAAHAEQIYESLTERYPQHAVDSALLHGVGLEGKETVRRTIRRADLDTTADHILEEFRAARLIIDVDDGTCLELTHDALFRQWHRLAALINANEERLHRITRLEHRAAAWQANPQTDDLLRGQTLAGALALAAEVTLSTAARQLLDASQETDHQDRARQSERVAEFAQQVRRQDNELAVALAHTALHELPPTPAATMTRWALTATPRTRRLFIGHTTGITSAVWLPDNQGLRTADKMGRVCTWDDTGRLAGVAFATDSEACGHTLLSATGTLALTEHDRGLMLWRVADGRNLGRRRGSLLTSFDSVSWGGDLCFAGTFDYRTVDVYRLDDDIPGLVTSVPATSVHATAWSPQGDRLAIASDDLLLVISIGEQTSEILRQQVAWSDPVLCWAPDGTRLAVSAAPAFSMRRSATLARERRTLWIYDTDTGQAAESAPPGLAEAMAWSPVEDVIAYAVHRTRHQHRVALIDVATGRTVERRARPHRISTIAWSSDGKRIGLGSSFHQVELWDVVGRSFRRLPTGSLREVSWSPEHKRAAIKRTGTTPEIIETDEATLPLRLGDDDCMSIAYSPLGDLVATAMQEQVTVWDARSGVLRAQWGARPRPTPKHATKMTPLPWVYGLAWSGDGSRLVVHTHCFFGRTRPALSVWDVAKAQRLAVLDGGEESAGTLTWSPDSGLIAAVASKHNVSLWRGDDYTLAHQWRTEGDGEVAALAWSNDSTGLAAAVGNQIEIWNVVQQHISMRCVGHTNAVRQISWSPEGNLIASISDDDTLYIWHTQDGRPLGVLDTPDGIVRSLSWQDTLIVTYNDGRILSWDVCGDQAKRLVEDREPRELTAEERERYGLPSASTD
ncbi:NACHT domain-containing protein [Micromonospora sp. STR1_7]|uniref:NACHT domain-containing protein n=1 Tax=Micromonospora parastrephiae TaxID=2806101 RepID=A0ABS1XNL8_9ACTN|nr:AAA family ATPase [Micromonospora parastrephiae]MBM0230855.1 NACHT domain-containing protein [Micromonospora parastrephiae]